MIQRLLTLFAAVLLTSCAGVHITKTQIASGAANPKYIYIRPFTIKYATFKSYFGTSGETAIRKSLAPLQFADALQEQLCKIAPSMVLKPGEYPEVGWLVEGDFDLVNANPPSRVIMHVRVIDVGASAVAVTDKDLEKSTRHQHGRIIYEFDVAGGSFGGGPYGSVYAPGIAYAPPFDFRNAAERIMMELSVDPHRFGHRDTTTIRGY